jgi:hypothetical protein
MPKHIGSSQVEGDNLRLMQSMLSPLCILMGSAKAADPGDGALRGVLEAGLRRRVSLAESGRSCILLIVCRS